MDSLPGLVESVPAGSAYVRLRRGGVTYVGGPYATVELACQSAGRLFCDVPEVTSIAILPRPQLATPAGDQSWYARASFDADGYTAVVGPYASRREARADLMGLADRGRIGGWHEWTIDYHRIEDAHPSWRPSGLRGRARWHRTSTRARPSPPAGGSTPTRPPQPADWTRTGERIARWIAAGGYPDTPRDDLLRDIVTLWDAWPADGAVWDVLGAVLAAVAASPPVAAGPADRLVDALLELTAAIEDRAVTRPGAEHDIRRIARERRASAADPDASG